MLLENLSSDVADAIKAVVLMPDEKARLVADVLWPASAEEREQRAAALIDAAFGRDGNKAL